MFGISLDGPQPVLILEYCAGGISSNHDLILIFHLIEKNLSIF
jgi:hypothetical protein